MCKVLLLNSSFFPNVGGVENSLRSLSEAIVKKGGDVSIVCGDHHTLSGEGERLQSNEVLFGANIFRYHSAGTFLSYFNCSKLLRTVVARFEPDVVVSRSFLTTICARLSGVKEVVFIVPALYQNQNKVADKGFKGRLKNIKYKVNSALELLSIKLARHVWVFSESMMAQVAVVDKQVRPVLCHPGVDENRFFPIDINEKSVLRKRFDLPERKIVLAIGRLVGIKGFEYAVKSLALLPDSYVLVVVGEGVEKDVLIELATDLNVLHRVFFFGKTEQPELFYKLSDVLAMTSLYEPFGQVLLEGTSSGLPVVAFDSTLPAVDTATNDIYREFPHLLVKVSSLDAETFSDGIKEAADIDVLSSENYKRFKAQYSWDLLAEKIIGHSSAVEK